MLCCTKTVISFDHMRKEDVDFKCNIIENPINMLIPRQEDTAQNLFLLRSTQIASDCTML